MKEREKWGTRSGFILAMVGSAVGLGNIWRFPTIVGRNGGGAFLIVYLAIIFVIGIPLLIGEITIGRRGKSNIVNAFKNIDPHGKWWIIGTIGVTTSFVILSFYSVISGWAMAFVFKFIRGEFINPSLNEVSNTFNSLVSNPYVPLIWHAIFMILVIFVVTLGIHKGIEKVSKILMPILFVLIFVLVIRSLTLEGSMEGVIWFLKPNFSQINTSVILGALGQVFFSLSLGMGTIITYGSYLGDKEKIPSNSVIIAFSDLAVAMMAGLIIIPAVFAYGIEPDLGMSLIFVTLPLIFGALPLGSLFGTLFFILLVIAALTSAIALLEVVVAFFSERFKWSRKSSAILTGSVIFLLGIPSALSMGISEKLRIFDYPFLEAMDLLSSKLLLPLGGLLTAIFIGWVWKPKAALAEIQKEGHKFALNKSWSFVVKFILPVVLSYIIISGFFEL